MITISVHVIQQSVPRRNGSLMTIDKQASHSEYGYGDDGHIDFKSDRDEVYLSRLQEDIEEDLEFSDEDNDEDHKTESIPQQQTFEYEDTHFEKFEVVKLQPTPQGHKSALSSMMIEVSEFNAFREAALSNASTLASPRVSPTRSHASDSHLNQNQNYDADNNLSDIDNFVAAQGSYRRHAFIPKGGGAATASASSSSTADSNPNNALVNLRVIFSEFEFDKSIDIVLAVHDADTTVEQTITRVVHSFDTTHPTKQLVSYQSSDYELRSVDDDELNDDDLDEDELDPPLTRSAKLCDFAAGTGHGHGATQVTMALCFNGKYINAMSPRTNTSMMSTPSMTSPRGNSFRLNPFTSRSPSASMTGDHPAAATAAAAAATEVLLSEDELKLDRERNQTFDQVAQATHMLFVRVFMPGTGNEVNVMLSVDEQNSAHKFLRDLFSALNRKRKTNAFNSQYFDFYYKHKTKQYGAIANSTKVTDLVDKNLIILPKVLSAQNSQFNEEEAYQFEFVRLANQVRQFKAFKIDKYRSKKKAFLLEVDRYRFVKTSLESATFSSGNNQPKPVPIEDIVSVAQTEKENGHRRHHDQVTVTYKVMNPNNKVKVKVKTYQMASNQEREDIVKKLRYLCVLRKMQG